MPRKQETIRQERANRKALFANQKAEAAKAKYDAQMKGKKVIVVPHPTVPKTWISKYIDE